MPIDRIHTSSRGWYARYEIWSNAETPKCLVKKHLPLEEKFIWDQYRWSLTIVDSTKGLKLQFPIRISSCLHKFTILGRVYFIQPTNPTEGLCQWVDLPFLFDHIHGTWWRPDPKIGESTQSLQEWRKQNCMLTFCLELGQCCHQILFVGHIMPVPQSCISLVVLEISSISKPSITLLGPLKRLYIKEHTRWVPEDLRPIFHPDLPLLIFTAPQPPWILACIWAYRGG